MKLAFFSWITCMFFCAVTTASAHSTTLLYNKGAHKDVVPLLTPQEQTNLEVQGVVTNSSGAALAGVNIFANNRTIALTDAEGKFTFKIAAGTQISFSYLSHRTYTMIVSKEEKNLRVTLQESSSELDELVVTALGIERAKKSLGYAAQQIDGSEVQDAPTNNWVNALNGKVPGMMLNTADGPMGSSDIILRGDKSLSLGSSGALIVVDGVIISNETSGNDGAAYSSNESPVDFGSTMSDINPEDIENISVLKGPGATALYGSRGANGAVIITTKSGGTRKGLGITFSSNTRINTVNRWPDYQSEYGQSGISSFNYYSFGDSEDGRGINSLSDWGAKLNTGVKYYQYDPTTHEQSAERVPWVSYPHNRQDFFRTGITTTNSISVEGGNNSTKARLSFSNLQNKFILPNTGYQRTSVSLSLNHTLSNKIKLGAKVNYNNKSSDNLPSSGYDNKSITYFIMQISPNMDSEWFKDYWITKDVRQRRIFSGILENPYFALYEELNPMSRHGVFGNVNFAYTITPELTLTAKSGMDMYQDISSSRQPMSSRRYTNGFYQEQNVFRYEINSDFLLSYKKSLSDDFNLGLSAGGNQMRYNYNRTRAYINQLDVPGQYTLANGIERPILTPYKSTKAINSLYGFANLSYKDYLFLEVTGRNDWSSSLPLHNNSYFYPSVNTSIVLSDLFDWHGTTVNYAKLRLSYAEVGNDTHPYRTENYYEPSSFAYSLSNPTTRPDADLRPERTRSYEAGAEAVLLRNRIGLDVAAYRADTYDQILNVPVERASGYYNAVMNAGTVRNQGLEMQLWFRPIYKKLKWRVTLNAAINRGKILELSDNIESIAMYSGPGGATILGVEGGNMGDIYGLGYVRNAEGAIVYDGGLPVLTTEIAKRGNAIPKWKGGIMNQFRYKNWNMKVLFDAEFGHDKYSLSFSRMMTTGKLKQTLPGREEGALIGVGVVQNDDGSFRPNDIALMPSVYYPTTYQRSNAEANIMDASFIKLREVALDYTIKSKYLSSIGVQNPSIGIYGRDLFIWTKWPVFDPESGTLDEGLLIRGLDIGQFPSTRSIGATVKVSF